MLKLCRLFALRLNNNGIATGNVHDYFKSPLLSVVLTVVPSCSYSKKKEEQKKSTDTVRRPKTKSSRPSVAVWQSMTVAELAKSMDKSTDFVFECLFDTQYVDDYDKADQCINDPQALYSIARVAGYDPKLVGRPRTSVQQTVTEFFDELHSDINRRKPTDPKRVVPRWPVVTIMGHVDHGKTTLLDYLRKSQIVQQEFGGITQHIGAFLVTLPESKKKITFLDTPGHAAFKSMRARGARATDIVILVVAADDGVMEQTKESIRFAREANVPIVVAINKIDKFGVDIEKVKHQLLAEGIQLEDYGGDVQCVAISALKGTGVKELQEAVLTQADIMTLGADPSGPTEGVVIESKITHGKGKVATILVQQGTIKKGCIFVAGTSWCRVKNMYDEHNCRLEMAPPSTPVEIIGWQDEDLPSPGEDILEAETERQAREVIQFRKRKQLLEKTTENIDEIEESRMKEREIYEQKRWEQYEATKRAQENYKLRRKRRTKTEPKSAEIFTKKVEEEKDPELPIIIKGDVDGSVEAILEVCETYNSTKCKFDIISFGVGAVTESDLNLAETFNGVIYAFNVKTPSSISQLAQERNITIKDFNIIYKLVDDIKEELNKQLPLVPEEEVLGQGYVLQVFKVTGPSGAKKVPVPGCFVEKGLFIKKNRIRFVRGDEIVYDGEISSMKRVKEDVSTASEKEEVGVMVSDVNKDLNFLPDDVAICYKIVDKLQQIDWSPPGF